MKLASYKVRGRDSFGAVVGEGMVDLKTRLTPADFGDAEAPKYPSMFYRAPDSLVGHEGKIMRPRESEQLDYEGEITQDDTTASMIKSFSGLIAYVSIFMTLKRGDIIVTGTPVKLGPKADPPRRLKPGDVIEFEVSSIGILRNTVVAEA
jgi:2-keto-4-pentenoate hydratase/2-oxohepta-3-ene-1,7-dioic acid hydratase in catechol pathway